MSLYKSFRALHRQTCREVIHLLRSGRPMSVAELAAQIEVGTRSNVSQALALLLQAEIVSRRRQGRQNIYQLRTTALKQVIAYLEGVVRDVRSR